MWPYSSFFLHIAGQSEFTFIEIRSFFCRQHLQRSFQYPGKECLTFHLNSSIIPPPQKYYLSHETNFLAFMPGLVKDSITEKRKE